MMSTPEEKVEKIQANIEKVSKILDAVVSEDRKKAILAMLEDDDFGQLYFTAPASSQERFHYAYDGGLVDHSFNVYKALRNLNKAFELGFSEESMFIVTMFHDVGKACSSTLKTPHYDKSTEDWRIAKGYFYQYSTDGVYMTNHLRSIFVLQSFGIPLSDEEFQAIYLNDGQYIDENKTYRLKECPLALFTHMADRIALDQEKAEELTI